MFRLFASVALMMLVSAEANSISASSRLGQKLLSKSRRLNDERDLSWMPDYSIKFQKCHSLLQVAGEDGGGGEGENQLYTQHLVEYSLCPSDSCTTGKGCKNGAKYIVNMREFVQMYTELKKEELEQACENIAENCDCENANDDEACEQQCYIDAGMEGCVVEEGEEEEDEDMERYLECEALEADEDNNNGNYNYNYNNNANYYREYFVGPYCSSNGRAIHLGVFVDQACSVKAEAGVYEEFNYGKSLPYSTSSMVEMDCISCEEPQEENDDNNNNNDQDEEVEVRELCGELYETAGRCEQNMNIDYKDNTACSYINTVLPRLESASRSLGVFSGPPRTAVVFAWLFGILAIGLGVWAFLLYRRLRRANVSLTDNGGNLA